jgi:hypothetical protein
MEMVCADSKMEMALATVQVVVVESVPISAAISTSHMLASEVFGKEPCWFPASPFAHLKEKEKEINGLGSPDSESGDEDEVNADDIFADDEEEGVSFPLPHLAMYYSLCLLLASNPILYLFLLLFFILRRTTLHDDSKMSHSFCKG